MTDPSIKETNHWEFGPLYESPDEKWNSQIYYHYDGSKIFTDEEIEKENKKEIEMNEVGVKDSLKDGFIHIPIICKDVNGDIVKMSSWVHPSFEPSSSKGFYEKHGMRYNIYVPSYKRAEKNLTATMLENFGIKNWYFAIDPSQYKDYIKFWPKERIILRDIRFRDPSMVDLGTSRKRPNKMSGTAGIYNNLLEFSRNMGEEKYWTHDDDFLGLAMKAHKYGVDMQPGEIYDKDNYYRCSDIKEEYGFSYQKFMNGIEEVSRKIRNHGFVGLEKFGTVFSLCIKYKTGTRVYSFYLSDNKTQVRHKYAMNNDVIASLEQSKRGLPPALFEGIGYNSGPTQAGGGLTAQYSALGTLTKGKILVKAEPNFTKISERYSRIHHTGNFTFYNKIRVVGTPVDEAFDSSPYYQSED